MGPGNRVRRNGRTENGKEETSRSLGAKLLEEGSPVHCSAQVPRTVPGSWRGPNTQMEGKTAVPAAYCPSEGQRGPKRPTPLSPLLPFTPSREPWAGRGVLPCCIWGRGRGHEAGTPYLLLQPGAMAPSLLDPKTNTADTHTSSRAARRDSARSRWPQI